MELKRDTNGHLLTLRKNMAKIKPMLKKTPAIRLGSAKGNLAKNVLWPNISGKFSTGFAKNPPNAGPSVLPTAHTSGRILKAFGCKSFSGTISATIYTLSALSVKQVSNKAQTVLIIPTILNQLTCLFKLVVLHLPFPLQPPVPARATIAHGKLVEKPHTRLISMVRNRARMTIGLRPK